VSDPHEPPERPVHPSLTPGDPLAGGTTTPPAEPPAYPGGYTSPPPPGAFPGSPPPLDAPPPFAPGTFQLSGWWRRVGAAIIDGLIIGAFASVLLVPFGIGAATIDSDTGIAALIGALVLTTLVFVVVAALYAPYMMARTNGQTVGRMATGIRVIRANGQPMTLGFAALREVVVKWLVVGIANSVTFGLAGLADILWPLWDEQNRALHDFVVNTRVVRS
jgi:uncharacterized RDD family membrane protein YckC